MSRVGILTFSDGRDFIHQGITSPKRASGTWRTRGSMPPASPAARTPPPRSGPMPSPGWTPPRRRSLPGSGRTTSTLSPGDITAEFRTVWRFLEIDLERLDV
jgi:hypothetical protein